MTPLKLTKNNIKELIEQSENDVTQKARMLKHVEKHQATSVESYVLFQFQDKSTILLRGIRIEQVFNNKYQNNMTKVLIKIGNSTVEGKIKTPSVSPANRDIMDTAAALPTKDEIVQTIEVVYTIWQAAKVLWLTIVSKWFKKS